MADPRPGVGHVGKTKTTYRMPAWGPLSSGKDGLGSRRFGCPERVCILSCLEDPSCAGWWAPTQDLQSGNAAEQVSLTEVWGLQSAPEEKGRVSSAG